MTSLKNRGLDKRQDGKRARLTFHLSEMPPSLVACVGKFSKTFKKVEMAFSVLIVSPFENIL